ADLACLKNAKDTVHVRLNREISSLQASFLANTGSDARLPAARHAGRLAPICPFDLFIRPNATIFDP
ncbi:MAG TPA: hypothetical protein VFQ54_01050, partial [Thermomicrobiales bacterium]|nr:hypothetical protein [Thermomicrobiales bacterium]